MLVPRLFKAYKILSACIQQLESPDFVISVSSNPSFICYWRLQIEFKKLIQQTFIWIYLFCTQCLLQLKLA